MKNNGGVGTMASDARKGVLMVVSGPAGSGKGTVIKLLREKDPGVSLSVSATTRAPRPGEVHGVHYYYITRDEFEDKIKNGEILEYTEYCDNLYGTPAEGVRKALSEGRDIVLEIEVDGAGQIKKKFPEAVSVMLIPPDGDTLEQRLRGRGTETEEVILRRMAKARTEIGMASDYDHIVVNGDDAADACADALLAIFRAEHSKYEYMSFVTDSFFKD